jgi:LysM domain-containing protein
MCMAWILLLAYVSGVGCVGTDSTRSAVVEPPPAAVTAPAPHARIVDGRIVPDGVLSEDLSRLAGPRPDGRFHRVSQGETLWSVSRRTGVSVPTVARDNGLPSKARLRVGQWLFIRDTRR